MADQSWNQRLGGALDVMSQRMSGQGGGFDMQSMLRLMDTLGRQQQRQMPSGSQMLGPSSGNFPNSSFAPQMSWNQRLWGAMDVMGRRMSGQGGNPADMIQQQIMQQQQQPQDGGGGMDMSAIMSLISSFMGG